MIYLLYGENSQERDVAIRKIIQEFIAVNGDMAVDILDTQEAPLSMIIDAITTVPFLSPKRMVILRYMSANKDLTEKVDTIFDRVSDTTDVLFIESRLDQRSIYTKTLKKRANDVRHFESVEGPQLIDWIIDQANQQGGTISYADAQLLIDRVGPNQQLLHNELTKLLLVSKQVSRETITSMTHISPHSSVFAMLDAIMQGNVAEASQLYYEQRLQGMEPQAILGMIAWQLHILAIVVSSKNQSVEDIAKNAKLNPFVVRKNKTIAASLNKAQMVHLLDAAIDSDVRIKTGKTKADQEIHILLLQLAGIIKNAS